MKNSLAIRPIRTHLNKLLLLSALMLLMAIQACQPDDTDKPQPKTGFLALNFEHHVDGEPLYLDSFLYENETGNKYRIGRLQYYVSNFVFEGCECGPQDLEDDYYLISNIDDPTFGGRFIREQIKMELPVGSFKSFEFGLGVDSFRNANGPYNEDLDFNYGMNWTWTGDYIFLKLEGKFIDTSGSEKNFIFHTGGNLAYEVVDLEADNPFEIPENDTTTLTLSVNLNEFFRNPYVFNLNSLNANMAPGETADSVSTNYRTMFSLKP